MMLMWGFQFDLRMSFIRSVMSMFDLGSNRCGANRGDGIGEPGSIRAGSFFLAHANI